MITVITSVTGGKDNLVEQQNTKGAEFIAFVDSASGSKTWNEKYAFNKLKSDRRNSRIPKIIPHKFTDSEYSIWIDGNMSLLKPAQELIDKYLDGYDVAVFKHPVRNCLYQEAIECAKRGYDDPEAIIEQVSSYEKEGFPKEYGLSENGMILRRHTKKVEEFNNAWLVEYLRFSTRDQLSFMYCVDKVGIPVNIINEPYIFEEDKVTRGGIVEMVGHLTDRIIGN